MSSRIWTASRDVLIGLIVMAGITVPWSVVVVANLRLSPQVPWAIPAALIYVSLVIAYLNGRSWPVSTREFRRSRFRARLLSPALSVWSLLAGGLAVTCLWLLVAAAGHLGPSVPGAEAGLAPPVLFAFVTVSAAITALGEEAGLRGFMQAPLESRFGPSVAITITTSVFVLIHASHGFTTLLHNGPLYIATGVVYGLLTYLTQSILPALMLHFLGDVVVFALRSSLIHGLAPRTQPEIALCLFAALMAATLSLLAFRQLASVSASTRQGRMLDWPAG